jgi:hypothetical protein
MICEITNLVFPERNFKERKIFLESDLNNNVFFQNGRGWMFAV